MWENFIIDLRSETAIWQLLVSGVMLAISYFMAGYTKSYVKKRIVAGLSMRKATSKIEVVEKYFNPLFMPIISIFSLTVGLLVFDLIYGTSSLIRLIIELVGVYLLIGFILIFSNSRALALLVGTFVLVLIMLSLSGMLDASLILLDNIAVKLGDFKLSLLMVIKTIFFVSIVLFVMGFVRNALKGYIKSISLQMNTRVIFLKLADISVYVIAFLVVLHLLQIDLTAFAVIGGALAVGIGIGLQKIAANFISGFILLFEGSIKINDLIELPDGTFGYVKYLGARGTIIEAFSGKEIIIPNEDFITKNVVNWTHSNKKARVELNFGVSYEVNLVKVQALILEAIKELPRAMKTPEPQVLISGLTDYEVNFLIYFWISDVTEGIFGARSDAYLSVWKKLEENDIVVPYPKSELYIKEMPSTKNK